MQAYYEHMPLRRSSLPDGGGIQIYRRARIGDLLDAHFLDTRQFRSKQPCTGAFDQLCPDVAASGSTVLGGAQEAWLAKSLREKAARWNLVAQQIMVMPLNRATGDQSAEIRNMDSWAGYDVARERLLSGLAGSGNVVVMTGDEHQNFAGELRRHAGKGDAVAVELVSTSISSGGTSWIKPENAARIRDENPFLKYSSDQRGYVLCEVTPSTWLARFRGVNQVTTPGGSISTLATATIEYGTPAVNLA